MSQLLDYTKKSKKSREKNQKIIFGSELSEANNEPTSRLPYETFIFDIIPVT